MAFVPSDAITLLTVVTAIEQCCQAFYEVVKTSVGTTPGIKPHFQIRGDHLLPAPYVTSSTCTARQV